MAKSLNKVQLIGNLTRDPELKYTPNGAPVCRFGLATNRQWTTDTGEKREEADFHNIVVWRKLAEICSQYLTKGKKVYLEGRLSTQSWTGNDGQQKTRTEIVVEDMIMLDGARGAGGEYPNEGGQRSAPRQKPEVPQAANKPSAKVQKPVENQKPAEEETPPGNKDEEISPDDIPF